jgi:chemotaxis regulatin CheY-phosphate phosphatase CheZ
MAADSLQVKIHREISELSVSIANLVDNFRKLKRPLVESQETVPQATNQLDKITQQTEAATNQMLDRIEHITRREEEVISGIKEMKAKAQAGDLPAICLLIDGLAVKANENLNDAFVIMDSLQFQDITAQQMDHAASLLEDLEAKLHQVLATVAGPESEGEMAPEPQARRVRAYDPHADLFEKKTNQEDIDSLFKSNQK